ncbi:radical SAM protein [Anaerotignum sp.]|uniref:radical SAM protein n=1 Tax=Anaerotignum sp. TaxID=2039241 RepID=UPI00289DA291|nr:radical SAM protein [Anaerotignum sp.]
MDFNNAVWEINKNVVFVQGALRGAIYDLTNELVYSIGALSCTCLYKVINNCELNNEEKEYHKSLIEHNLVSLDFSPRLYNYTDDSPLDAIGLVWLEITQACNAKCIHCYEGCEHISTKNPLSLPEWQKIINELKDIHPQRIVIIGGEPCVHKDLCKILNLVSEIKSDVTLFTNGSLLNEDIVGILKNHDMRVKLSLYGNNAAIHDNITQLPGSFEKLLKSIDTLQKRKIDVSVAIVLMKENQDYYEEISDFVNRLGVSSYKFDVIRNVYNGEQSKHTPTLKTVTDLRLRKEANFNITKRQFESNYVHNSCWYNKLVITDNGDVLPCVFERNIKYGNIRDKTIKEIVNSSITKKCWGLDCSQIDGCNKCEYRFACKDCRPLAIAQAGNIYAKNPSCNYNPELGGWINE